MPEITAYHSFVGNHITVITSIELSGEGITVYELNSVEHGENSYDVTAEALAELCETFEVEIF